MASCAIAWAAVRLKRQSRRTGTSRLVAAKTDRRNEIGMKYGLPCSGKKRFCKSTLPERLMEECAAMSSAGIIGAIQIKLNRRERRDAGFDIGREQ
jgi:hypothetical protein